MMLEVDKALKNIVMKILIRANLKEEKQMELENIGGKLGRHTMEAG